MEEEANMQENGGGGQRGGEKEDKEDERMAIQGRKDCRSQAASLLLRLVGFSYLVAFSSVFLQAPGLYGKEADVVILALTTQLLRS